MFTRHWKNFWPLEFKFDGTLCSHGTVQYFCSVHMDKFSNSRKFVQCHVSKSLPVIENQPKNKSGFFQTRDTLISIGHVNMSVATHKVIYHQKSTVPPISASPRALLKRMLRGTLSVCKMNPLTSLRSCDPGDSCQMSNLPSPLMLRTWDK